MNDLKATNEFNRLLEIVKTLRGQNGCQWDKAQTHRSLIPYILEETYEVIEAIDEDDLTKLKEELGDLLLHIVFQANLGEEEGAFNIADSINSINEKLIRRHPHVFGDVKVNSIKEIKENWEEIKLREGRTSLMEGVPKTLPALVLAQRVQLRAAEVGFDWKQVEDVWEKIEEELNEFKEAIELKNKQEVISEFGDLLFSLVNLSRFLEVNSEEALRKTINKFVRRFKSVEKNLSQNGKRLKDATLEEMDNIWNNTKISEDNNA